MQLDDHSRALVEAARTVSPGPDQARRLIGLLDLTSLTGTEDEASIEALAQRATTPFGPVAALCIPPRFVAVARRALGPAPIKVATVVNFPGGEDGPELVHDTAQRAASDGADEIDLVFPYKRFLADAPPPASKTLRTCRDACGANVRIKVILETGAFDSSEALRRAATVAIDGGADFLKTSTGKIAAGPTLEAAAVLLTQIQASGLPVGFKVAGGIRDLATAAAYLHLVEAMMGKGWATKERFRIGASTLLDELLVSARNSA